MYYIPHMNEFMISNAGNIAARIDESRGTEGRYPSPKIHEMPHLW
jgi:hypothetical protein